MIPDMATSSHENQPMEAIVGQNPMREMCLFKKGSHISYLNAPPDTHYTAMEILFFIYALYRIHI